MKFFFSLLFFLFYNSSYSQDIISETPKIVCKKDTLFLDDLLSKYIFIRSELDSTEERIQAFRTELIKDTLLSVPGMYDKYDHKKNVNMWSDFSYNPNSTLVRIKSPLNNIYLIKQDRNKLRSITTPIMWLSATSALIAAPLISIDKPFNLNRYYSVAISSVAIFIVTTTVRIIWGSRRFYMKPHKNKKVWNIIP